MVRDIACEIWDVFTDVAFGGNQLAVVPDARGLDTAGMQRIAREFGYSESVFMLPPEAGGTIRLRIFTPGREIPFAGHPTIGAAISLARAGTAFGHTVSADPVIEEGVGPITCTTLQRDGLWHAAFTTNAPFERLGEYDPAAVAACTNLPATALSTALRAPVMASKGLPFLIAETASRADLAAAAPDPAAFAALRDRQGESFLSIALYHRAAAGDAALRVFAPLDDTHEDPATGSAAAALAALLCACDGAPVELTISQGTEMGRPSRITAAADCPAPGASRVRIGGSAVPVLSGHLHFPE